MQLEHKKNLLLIFTRNPELGKCKTRLAATIGKEPAFEIYKFLLSHTEQITRNVKGDKQVYYSEEIWENDQWDDKVFHKKLQKGKNLGERMQYAFEQGFKDGYEKIIVIGSDLYDITTADIENAFLSLNDTDYTIGPAEDGGYYLLGMKKLLSSLFENKDWGKSSVLKNTLENLNNKEFVILPIKNDVDTYEDIKNVAVFKPYLKHMQND